MAKLTGDASQFLAELDHPLKSTIVDLRDAILAADDQISETVKWNAPNFRYRDEDRVTFNLRPRDRVQLIFHRGVKKSADELRFTDGTGLLTWAAPDRAILTLTPEEVAARRASIIRLVTEWMEATADPPA